MAQSSTSLNEIAYNLLNVLRGGKSNHGDNIDIDQIKKIVKYYRVLFIRRDQERNFNRFNQFEQDLGHVDVSLVDTAEDDTIKSNKLILRTDSKIPAPVRLKRTEAITFVGCINKFGEPFPLMDNHRAYFRQFDKFTSNKVDAYYRDGHIYLSNMDDEIETVNIRGIFEDPEEVFDFVNASGIEFYSDDSPFPIPADMLEGIQKGILNGELPLAVESINDTTADRQQDTE